ncbi:S-adenosylmethionine decarboxylase proenzyme [Prochlorococcus marinus str. MIT 9321]|uniref:S-adenosylmethionine decarboxylase proenzyme n=1 Tax=Prochlorococcus marinus str. MIT 9401 TaxID=167551 RepID=A0A0A2B8R2_PROMR|nr:adenosylmethionine decarboxylase [Prochlorococcus marinus]KGG03145.1 S-adenosylmethionine decarboxylase proenzyme [Prochlorococcus marinus str. MIT 9321]KGG06549.1 S-adenosylmethionine decarboxylase proenzyme [Prochlorococcus marinus str. MIT 9322]KGG10271.1 S-adenosylmethionine decarboxylase proenzyme [Prochlorococcus marinus str. MIT 9401]
MEVHKKNQILSSFSNDEKSSHQSKHLLLELYGCAYEKLNDESFLRCTLNKAAKLANATVLNLISNKFEPQGVTAVALLAESHISIHTWPESNYSAVDIFTCGQNMLPELASQYLIEALKAKEHYLRVIERNPPQSVLDEIREVF